MDRYLGVCLFASLFVCPSFCLSLPSVMQVNGNHPLCRLTASVCLYVWFSKSLSAWFAVYVSVPSFFISTHFLCGKVAFIYLALCTTHDVSVSLYLCHFLFLCLSVCLSFSLSLCLCPSV